MCADKRLIAEHGEELVTAARSGGAQLRFAAAVGGVAPVIESIRQAARRDGISQIRGILNGTTNFVFEQLAAGESLESAISAAKSAGLAEHDISRDLSGQDAADKLVIAIHAATGRWLRTEAIRCEPFSQSLLNRISDLPGGFALRQIAEANIDDSSISAEVRLCEVPTTSLWGRCRNNWNVVQIRSVTGRRRIVRGKGAGAWPTAESILADLFDIAHTRLGQGGHVKIGEQNASQTTVLAEAVG